MLSPGEAVIPTKMAKKYGGLINGMIAGNIPGYSQGDVVVNPPRKGRQSGARTLQLPAGETFDLAHFSGSSRSTGQELKDWAETQDQKTIAKVKTILARQQEILEKSTGKAVDILTESFQIYDKQVVAFSSPLNNLFGTSGKSDERSAPIEKVRAEVKKAGVFTHAPFANDLLKAGVPAEEAAETLTKLQAVLEEKLDSLGEGIQLAGSDLDRILTETYDDVTSTSSELVQKVREDTKNKNAFLTKEPGNNARQSVGSTPKFNSDRPGDISAIQQLFPDTPVPFGSVNKQFTVSAAEGRQSPFKSADAVTNAYATLKKFDEQEALRLGNLVTTGEMSKQEFYVQLEAALLKFNITLNDVISATEQMVLKSIPKEINAASESMSPSQETRRSAQNLVDGVVVGLQEGIPEVRAAGENLGQAAANDGRKPAGRRVRTRVQTGVPGAGGYPVKTTPEGSQVIIGDTGRFIQEEEKPGKKPLTPSQQAAKDKMIRQRANNAFGPGAKIKNVGAKVASGVKGFASGPGMMVASMAGMPLMMTPGLEGLGMAISVVLPMLMMMPPQFAAVAAALAAVVGVAMSLVAAGEQQRKKSVELANATVMSQTALEKMSADIGTVSETEQRKNAEDAKFFGVSEKRLSAAEQYIQETESGQKLLEGINAQREAGIASPEIAKNLALNIASAVAQNVISQKQGTDIIAALGRLSGISSIGSAGLEQYSAYTEDISKAPEMISANALGMIRSRTQAETVPETASERSIREARQLQSGQTIAPTQNYSAGLVAQSMNAYGQAMSNTDAINAQYDTLLKTATTQREINKLEQQRTESLTNNRANAEAIKLEIEAQAAAMGSGFDTAFLANIEAAFSKDSDAYQTAEKIASLPDSASKIRLQMDFAGGNMSVSTADYLVNQARAGKNFETQYDLIVNAEFTQEADNTIRRLEALESLGYVLPEGTGDDSGGNNGGKKKCATCGSKAHTTANHPTNTGSSGEDEDKKLTALTNKLDKRQKAMAVISLREAAINKKYEERKKALEDIARINGQIAEQQRGQLDIANALASGDIAAAARAVQAERARSSAFAQEQQMKALDEQRQSEIDNLSIGGKSRKSLQEIIDKLNMQIAMRQYRTAAGGGMMKGYSVGGKVMSYFAAGGKPLGSDTIPAMLTPGEFVIKRPAVKNFGVKNLEKINNGNNPSSGVYNYNVNVNVATGSDPDKIARTVVTKIRSIDKQRLGGNVY